MVADAMQLDGLLLANGRGVAAPADDVPQGCKRTEIGVLPENWEVEALGRVATLQRGFDLPKHARLPGKVPIVSSSGPEDYHSQSMVHAPGVVTGRYGTIGQVYFVESDFWPLNTTLWVSEFHGNSPKWAYYLLQSVDFASHSGKSGVPGINRNDIHQEVIALPPRLEQEAIAEALGDADGAIRAAERVVEKKRAVKQAALHALLTPTIRLPGFYDEWETKALGRLLQYEQPTNYLVESADYVETGQTPVLTAGKSQVLGYTEEESGVYDNIPVILFDDFTTSSKLIDRPFKVKSSAVKFLTGIDSSIPLSLIYELMQLVDFPLADHKRYWISEFQLEEIELPNDSEEQRAIAAILSNMNAEIAALEAWRDKLKAIKQGMMQTLLTGKVRLV